MSYTLTRWLRLWSGKLSKKQAEKSTESSSTGAVLIDKIMSHMEDNIIEELEDLWVYKSSKIVNFSEFCFSLAQQKVLKESHIQLTTRPEGQEELWAKKAIERACSKKAVGSLIFAFQRSGNEGILEETLEWFETTLASRKYCPISVRRLAIHAIKADFNRVNFALLEQFPPLDDLEEFAKFDSHLESRNKRTFNLELDKEKMINCVADFGVTSWNWSANERQTIELGVRADNVTCMQSDEDILVLGTAEGFLHVLDAKKVKQRSRILFGDGEPVHSLKFVGSTLVVLTRPAQVDKIWWVDISRSDMQLLNQRPVIWSGKSGIYGFFVHPYYTFYYKRRIVHVRLTKSGESIANDCRNCWLDPPADMSTLSVVDLGSTKGNVVAGCQNGALAIWSLNNLMQQYIPLHVIRGHQVAVVSLCAIDGNLLSLDQSGKLFMWSGYDLDDKYATPVPLVVAENVSNVKILVANGRWFGSSSSQDETVSSGTLPYLCLRRR